jgi:hypothetical protein
LRPGERLLLSILFQGRGSVIKCKVLHPTQSLHTSFNLPAEGNDIEMLRPLIDNNLIGIFVCAQAVGNTNEWSIGHVRKATVCNMKKRKKKQTNGLPTSPPDYSYPTKGVLYR